MKSFDEPDLTTVGGSPWPSPGADLLGDGSDWWLVACMDWPRDRWIGYVHGYWKAAGLIVEHVANTRHDQDYLVYPFMMCWRHYIELQLKNLIILVERSRRESREFPHTHKIDVLWHQLRSPLSMVVGRDERANMANVERILVQLQGFDPTAEHFRYPVRTDGSETLSTLPRVHLRHFHEAMEGVAHFLDAVDNMLREMIDGRDEHAAY